MRLTLFVLLVKACCAVVFHYFDTVALTFLPQRVCYL